MQKDATALLPVIHVAEYNFAVPWTKSINCNKGLLDDDDRFDDSNIAGYAETYGLTVRKGRTAYVPTNEIPDQGVMAFDNHLDDLNLKQLIKKTRRPAIVDGPPVYEVLIGGVLLFTTDKKLVNRLSADTTVEEEVPVFIIGVSKYEDLEHDLCKTTKRRVPLRRHS